MGKLYIANISSVNFPKNLLGFKLIIPYCSCMLIRRWLLSRLKYVREQEVPITNFGIALAELNGILDRACNF